MFTVRWNILAQYLVYISIYKTAVCTNEMTMKQHSLNTSIAPTKLPSLPRIFNSFDTPILQLLSVFRQQILQQKQDRVTWFN